MSFMHRSGVQGPLVRSLAVGFAAVLLATACAARNKVEGAQQEQSAEGSAGASHASATPAGGTFGEIDSPCGDGDYSVEADEAGGTPDVLRLGVANDRTSQIRPGLNKELWDASVAFAEWGNEQGGVGGLPIELVDLDGKLLEVNNAMAKACNSVFMMVGGGYVQDDLEFSGKEGSDFHLCGLAAIPGFTTSPQKAESNGQIQPVPHPASESTSLWVRDFAKLHPEEAESMAIVWGDLPSMETNVYDKVFVESAGVKNASGSIVRSGFHPFEEADKWPAVQQYVDIMEQHTDGGKVAVLGMQSFSAWLLFATAANDCATDNDGILTRACVLEAADAMKDWTGGGLHGPTNPGPEGGPSPECAMLLTVNEDGEFERLYPEIGSEEDAVDGFSCADDAVFEVPTNEGKGVIGENQPL